MPYVDVFIDASEILEDLDDDEIRSELERRHGKMHDATDQELLDLTYRMFRGKDCPEPLREFIYRKIGKIL